MKAIYITGVFCFLCFCTAQANPTERQVLYKEFKEILDIMNIDGFNKGHAMLDNFEKKNLSRYPDIHSHTLLSKAYCHLFMDQLDSTHHNLDKAELLINDHGLDSLRARLYRIKGMTYWKKLDFKSAIRIHLKGLKSAENHANVNMEMLLSFDLGFSHNYMMLQDSARFYISKSLNIATKESDNMVIAMCKTVLSEIEKDDGNLLKAMEYIFEAYEIGKIAKGDTELTRYEYVATFLIDIYYGLGNLSSSLELINFIIEQKKAIHSFILLEAHLLVKSSILLRMDSIESSTLVLAELEQSHQISKNPLYYNQMSALKGGLMYKKKQWDAAEEELSKLLLKIDSVSLKRPIGEILVQGLSQLAKLKFQKGDYKKSIFICEQLLKKRGIGYHYKKEFLGTLAACHKGLGNYGTAYKYLLQRDAIRDTIDRFYERTLRLSKEQEMLDQQKADKIEKLKYKNELSQVEAAGQRNLISIVGILALLVSGMLFLWGRQRKLVLENSLADVKQQLLKRQVNPHFIFNVLNSIQNSVLTHKKEKSIELISKFSKLTRQVLQNSDKVMVPIHEELLLLTNYMDLEKVRTQNKFDYEVMIDEGIDMYNEEIPSMILQLFVENAIWHGILPKEERGLIKVKIERDKNRIKVIISDDGIGRKRSVNRKTKDQQEKISMGMSLTRQLIFTLNKKYKDNIELHINDGMNGEGTQVLLIA